MHVFIYAWCMCHVHISIYISGYVCCVYTHLCHKCCKAYTVCRDTVHQTVSSVCPPGSWQLWYLQSPGDGERCFCVLGIGNGKNHFAKYNTSLYQSSDNLKCHLNHLHLPLKWYCKNTCKTFFFLITSTNWVCVTDLTFLQKEKYCKGFVVSWCSCPLNPKKQSSPLLLCQKSLLPCCYLCCHVLASVLQPRAHTHFK